MNPFNVTLTHAQANLIFNAVNVHVAAVQTEAQTLVNYLDTEFKKANTPASSKDSAEETGKQSTEKPDNC